MNVQKYIFLAGIRFLAILEAPQNTSTRYPYPSPTLKGVDRAFGRLVGMQVCEAIGRLTSKISSRPVKGG